METEQNPNTIKKVYDNTADTKGFTVRMSSQSDEHHAYEFTDEDEYYGIDPTPDEIDSMTDTKRRAKKLVSALIAAGYSFMCNILLNELYDAAYLRPRGRFVALEFYHKTHPQYFIWVYDQNAHPDKPIYQLEHTNCSFDRKIIYTFGTSDQDIMVNFVKKNLGVRKIQQSVDKEEIDSE